MSDLIAAAVCNGSSLQLLHALQKFGKDVNLPTAFDAYPLQLAVWRNSLAAVQQLLEAGADANLQDGESGWSSVHKALYQGSLAAAAMLLSHGGSLEVVDSKGRLPLDLVSRELRQQLRLAEGSSSATAAAAGRAGHGATALDCVAAFSSLYSWGNGANFTLGTGSTDLHLTPARVELHHPDGSTPSSSSSSGGTTQKSSSGGGGSSTAASSSSNSSSASSTAVAAAPVGRIVAISAAKFHSAVVTEDGRLYTFGYGRGGRLGHADFHIHSGSSAQIFPRQVTGLGKRTVVAVAAAKHHTLVATSAGEVFSWGINKDGRLGYGAVDSQPTPKKVTGLPPRQRVVALAAANKHSAAVMCSGDVYTWGANASGQLGYGSSDSGCNPTPRLVEALKGRKMVKVAAAKHHTVVLSADGEVYTFGHKVVTPRKVLLAGSRDTARAAPAGSAALAAAGAAAGSGGEHRSSASSPAGLTAASSSGGGGSEAAGSAAAAAAVSVAVAAADPVSNEHLTFHHGQADVFRPFAVAVTAGAAHTSCLTRTGVVLTWPSAAPSPRALEVAGPLAGLRVVSLSAGKNRTAVVTEEGAVYMWESRDGKKRKKVPGAGEQQQQQTPTQDRAAGTAVHKDVGVLKRAVSQAGAASAEAEDSQQKKQQQQGSATAAPAAAVSAVAGSSGSSSGGATEVAVVVAASTPTAAAGSGSSSSMQAGGAAEKPPVSSSSSSYGASSNSSSSSDSSSSAALKAMLKAWVGPTAPVVPLRVHGPRHITQVAVGEKHSLALQSWVAPVLPEHGEQFSNMLAFGQAAAAAKGDRAADDGGDLGLADEEAEDDSLEYTAAAYAAGAAAGRQLGSRHNSSRLWLDSTTADNGRSSGSSLEPLHVICERAVAVQLVEPRTAPAVLEYADVAGAKLLKAYCLAVAVRNLDMTLSEARHAFEALPPHLLAELEQLYKQLAFGMPPLSSGAEQQPLQQTQQLHDLLLQDGGTHRQQQQQQQAPVVAAEARPRPELGFNFVLPGGEYIEQEEEQQQQQLGAGQEQQQPPPRQGEDGAHQQHAGPASAVQGPPGTQQHLYRRLLAVGRRPTNHPGTATGLGSWDHSTATGGGAGGQHAAAADAAHVAAATRQALAAASHSWFETEPHEAAAGSAAAAGSSSSAAQLPLHLPAHGAARPSSSFTSDGGRLAAVREAAQKLHRNLLKKLQQIESLEAKQLSGGLLDPQQMAKLSLKGSILDALGQLRAGTAPLEDIQAMLARAQAVAHKLYLVPSEGEGAAAGGTARSYGSLGASNGLMGSSPLSRSPCGFMAAAAAAAASGDRRSNIAASSAPAGDKAALQQGWSSTRSSRDSGEVAAVTTLQQQQQQQQASPVPAKTAAKRSQQQRKGGLSMFLTGELDKPLPIAATATAIAATAAWEGSGSAAGKPEAAKAPAWGGVALQQAATAAGGVASLRHLLTEEEAGSSTQQQQQQQRAANGAPLPLQAQPKTSAVVSGGHSTPRLAAVTATGGATCSSPVPAAAPKPQPSASPGFGNVGSTPLPNKPRSAPLTGVGSSSMGGPAAPPSAATVVTAGSDKAATSGSGSSSSTLRLAPVLPPAGPFVQHTAAASGSAAHPPVASAGAVGSTAGSSSGGFKLSLADFVAHKRSSPLATARSKSKTGTTAAAAAAAGAGPGPAPAAGGPAWGGVLGSSPPAVSSVSLRDIQQEQEQLRATTGWAAYQREKVAAAASGGSGAQQAAGAGSPSSAISQLRAAGGLTRALQLGSPAAAAGSSPAAALAGSPAGPVDAGLLGSSPAAATAAGSGLSRSFKGSSSSSFLLQGSSPPAVNKWYIKELPQVRSLADIQSEEALVRQQQQLLQQIEEERAAAEQERQERRRRERRQGSSGKSSGTPGRGRGDNEHVAAEDGNGADDSSTQEQRSGRSRGRAGLPEAGTATDDRCMQQQQQRGEGRGRQRSGAAEAGSGRNRGGHTPAHGQGGGSEVQQAAASVEHAAGTAARSRLRQQWRPKPVAAAAADVDSAATGGPSAGATADAAARANAQQQRSQCRDQQRDRDQAGSESFSVRGRGRGGRGRSGSRAPAGAVPEPAAGNAGDSHQGAARHGPQGRASSRGGRSSGGHRAAAGDAVLSAAAAAVAAAGEQEL